MAAPSIGVFLPTMSEPGTKLADVVGAARLAESLGFESVWAVDQLVAGTGAPFVDATVALAGAAGATERIGLGYGVMVLPIHHPVWAAKQVASLQQLSHGRALLGVGVGGDRHERSWPAAGVPRSERGGRTDAALAVLADLIAGGAVDLDGATVQLAPGVAVPPIAVGGMADAALERAVRVGGGWFALPLPPRQLAVPWRRLRALADASGRRTPEMTASVTAAIDGDPTLPDDTGLARLLTNPDGVYGMPAAAIGDVLLRGGPGAVARRVAELHDLGASRVVFTLVAGDWHRQAELLAEATG
jgi:alkanesulfonate monooxygenase SsuD/methylene tetrahydromethanopterin reductase-like flavin-dependent oxidoreductase (luciferase family)